MTKSCTTWMVLTVSLLLGCDKGAEHPSRAALETALHAVQYGDADGLQSVHLEATSRSVYCTEEPMQRLWEKAGDVADGGACDRLGAVSPDEVDSAPDELRFLLQVVKFRCEEVDETCSDYGARTLRDGLSSSDLSQATLQSWEIRKFLGDDANAVAYVDISTGKGVVHRAVKLTKRDDRWFVVSGLLEGEGR